MENERYHEAHAIVDEVEGALPKGNPKTHVETKLAIAQVKAMLAIADEIHNMNPENITTSKG